MLWTEDGSRDRGVLPLREAIALGLIQGPAELLPVSSSSHTALVPWLLRWRTAELDPARRRAFEVALHAGAAAALVVDAHGRLRAGRWRPPSGRRARSLALAAALPALAGYRFEALIDRRLSGPRTIAGGLAGGALAMAAAEAIGSWRERAAREPGALDGLLLGCAQALALVPGVSRNGATLAVARARGFERAEAERLSWEAGVPVMLGAALLKATRSARPARGMAAPLLAGAAAAFASTALGRARIARRMRARTPLGAYVAYRALLALTVMRSLRVRAGRADARRGGARAQAGRADRQAPGRRRRRSP